MIIELVNHDVAVRKIINMFNNIDLNPSVINEMYQRGLFRKMVETFSSNMEDLDSLLSTWIRLAGKICINRSIQEKFLKENIHKVLLKRGNEFQSM